MTHDPIIQRAFEAASAVLALAGYTGGHLLVYVDREQTTLALDTETLPPAPLAEILRRAADQIDPTVD